MSSYTFWFVIFALLTYFIVTDNSVARAFYMLTQLVRVQYERVKWWAVHNPANPIVKYFIWRRSIKMAEELIKEFEEKK